MNDITIESQPALPPMIDTHCHLDDRQFDSDLEDVLAASRQANVNRWVLIGYDPKHWTDAIELADTHAGMFHTLGVHPACATAWSDEIGQRLRTLLVSSGAVGVGEAGLDFFRDNAEYDVQAAAFAGQLEIAADLGLPLVIHMRSAEDQVLDLLEDGRRLPTLLFHSFEGSERLMDFVLRSDSYVGVGGLATRQRSGPVREQLMRVTMERLVLETDSPYLVPARQKDRRNQPAQIVTIATIMADYLGAAAKELAAHSTANAERLFGLNHVN